MTSIFGAILTSHTTRRELTYPQILGDAFFRNCTQQTDCTWSLTNKYIFSVYTVLIYSCIKVRIRLIFSCNAGLNYIKLSTESAQTTSVSSCFHSTTILTKKDCFTCSVLQFSILSCYHRAPIIIYTVSVYYVFWNMKFWVFPRS